LDNVTDGTVHRSYVWGSTCPVRPIGSPEYQRLHKRLVAICTFGNLDGAVFVFVYLDLIAPRSYGAHSWVTDAITFTLFGVVAFSLEAIWSELSWRRAIGWFAEEREPTPAEQNMTLRIPLVEAGRSFVAWVAASVFFSVYALSFGAPAAEAGRVGLTIFDGGLVTCAIVFLLFERALRPAFAAALARQAPQRAMTIGVRPRLLLTWALGSGVPLAGLALLPYSNQHTTGGGNMAGSVITLSVVGLVVGLFTTVITARSVADPLEAIQRAIGKVGKGQLDVSVAVDDGGEVGLLQSGVNQMVAGLRERHRLADLFGRHVGPEVARQALEQGTGLTSEQRDATAMFVDLIGSTALAEVLAPEQVLETLNAFFDTVASAVAREGGWVNKFQGDGALCVFGAPALQADHAARALRVACALRHDLEQLANAHPGIDAGIGVASGTVVAGNVGTEQRYEYTIIGGPVNVAARLTELAKERDGRVMAAASSMERAADEASRWTVLGTVALRGQSVPTTIYEPIPVREPVP
ncbi:MAG: adenylate cyclase, partial [Actinomycetota bacterium]|nr:adenylate cyclase [Actinomycetota bacterium]